jgi:hypothetical protein
MDVAGTPALVFALRVRRLKGQDDLLGVGGAAQVYRGGRVRRPRAGDVALGNSTTLAVDGAGFGDIEKYRCCCSGLESELHWLEKLNDKIVRSITARYSPICLVRPASSAR